MDLWGNVQSLWETTLKGKGSVPGGRRRWVAFGGYLLRVWSLSAKFQLQVTATHVHGPPAIMAQRCGMKTEEQGPELFSGFARPPAQPAQWNFLEVIPGRG